MSEHDQEWRGIIFIVMATHYPHTPEQVYNSLQFKIIKKMLLSKYPWIKDVTIDEDIIHKYSIIYLMLEMDPFEFAEFYHTRVDEGLAMLIDAKGKYEFGYLSLASDLSQKESEAIQTGIQYLIDKYAKSDSIPPHLRLKTRHFDIEGFVTYKKYVNNPEEDEEDV